MDSETGRESDRERKREGLGQIQRGRQTDWEGGREERNTGRQERNGSKQRDRDTTEDGVGQEETETREKETQKRKGKKTDQETKDHLRSPFYFGIGSLFHGFVGFVLVVKNEPTVSTNRDVDSIFVSNENPRERKNTLLLFDKDSFSHVPSFPLFS